MNIVVILNFIASISIILASFYCLVRARFSDKFISKLGISPMTWKVLSIIGIILGFWIAVLDYRLMQSSFDNHKVLRTLYIVRTIGFAVFNYVVWRILLIYRTPSSWESSCSIRQKKAVFRCNERILHFRGIEDNPSKIYLLTTESTTELKIKSITNLKIKSITNLSQVNRQRIEFQDPIEGDISSLIFVFS